MVRYYWHVGNDHRCVYRRGLALVEYRDESSAERVKETLEYVDRYNRDAIQEARLTIEKILDPKAEKIFKRTNAGETTFLIKEIRENKLEDDFSLLFHFFENLHACTCAKLCDETTVRRFFAKDAYDHWGFAYPYIADQRGRLKDESFGRGIESIAKSLYGSM